MHNYQDLLNNLKSELFNAPVIKFEFSTECYKEFERIPGLYAVYDKDVLIYVGETGNLRKRMMDIRNTQNHNIPRLLGESRFGNHEHYWRASSTKKFHPEIEGSLVRYIESNIYIRVLTTEIGRKELEELITSENEQLLNKKKKRI